MSTEKSQPTQLPASGIVANSGLRAVRQRQLHKDVVTAGLALFEERGFEASTVADIAARAGISRRTFFRHFQSKDDVVFDWMNQIGETVHRMLAARPESELPLQAMQHTFLALASHLVAEGPRALANIKLIYNTPSLTGRYHDEQAKWEAEFVAILLRQRPLSSIDVFRLRVQVSTAITAFVVAVKAWAESESGQSLKAWVVEAFSALQAGSVELGVAR